MKKGDEYEYWIPYLVFGFSALVAAFSSYVLPETFKKRLPENISEALSLNSTKLTAFFSSR